MGFFNLGGSVNGISVADEAARLVLTVEDDAVQLRTLVFQTHDCLLFEAIDLAHLDDERGWFEHGQYNAAPHHISAPVITGNPFADLTVEVFARGFPEPSQTFSWEVSPDAGETWGVGAGSGQTSDTYTPHVDEQVEGTRFRCAVTLTNTFGADSVNSNEIVLTAPVLSSVTLTGLYSGKAPIDTSPLGVTPTYSTAGVPAPTLEYVWRYSSTGEGSPSEWEVRGATGAQYTPVADDDGNFLACTVTATNATNPTGGSTMTTAGAEAGFPPVIDSIAFEDGASNPATLSVEELVYAVATGTQNGATATYEWKAGANGTTVVGTSQSYEIRNEDISVLCKVTWTNAFGSVFSIRGPSDVE